VAHPLALLLFAAVLVLSAVVYWLRLSDCMR
jgi:hypothetical protein